MQDLTPCGYPYPLGPTVCREGTNFSVYSASATGVELVLFSQEDGSQPARTISLSPVSNRTSRYWHIFVPGIKPGQRYGYRADGPSDITDGQRFDRNKVLIDPYAKSTWVGPRYSRSEAGKPGDNAATSMKSVVTDLNQFDWEGDRHLKRPFRETVIYEMHVAGFTRNPNSGVSLHDRGTYLGVKEKIPYLKALGVTAVELMPVFQFDSQTDHAGLSNYWGYNPVSFFSPHLAYSSSKDPLICLDEFRTMVKALHREGIEVILDVVYNHTAEGDEHGPTLCFRGLENNLYYILNKDKASYADYSGTGNTLKANHSVVRRLILDSLRYWASEMHIDGFRFDLASILSRSDSGEPMMQPPILWDIDSDPILAGTKLIAEAWDASGLYQVGNFGPDRWKEWNGQFRDDIRSFVKGDRNSTVKLSKRITGSLDLYKTGGRPVGQSINFVTCHDGFTLNDLVSFNSKHNGANDELNRDGADSNLSWNCGKEGLEATAEIDLLRTRQIKNFLTLTLLSVGTPMLLMGDEIRRTQGGNNNAYCQDNENSWFDWNLCSVNSDLERFVQQMIRLRLHFDEGPAGRITLEEYLSRARVEWHGVDIGKPDWSADSHSLACSMHSLTSSKIGYILMNAYWEPLRFQLPSVANYEKGGWLRLVDTSLPSPDDVADMSTGTLITTADYLVNPRSVVVLHHDYS